MSGINLSQLSFNAGELAPELYARIDFVKHGNGVKTMKNFIARAAGGAQNRPGQYFTAEVRDSSKRHRAIPFQFSTEQAYCLEFGHNTMRVVMDGASVTESGKTITGATQAKPVELEVVAHGYSNGDWVIIDGITGMVELNGKTFVVANKTTDTFELNDVDGNPVDGTSYSAYVSGGLAYRIYEIATPYSYDELPDLAYVQSADVMYLVHPLYYPRKLSRTGHTSWTLEIAPFTDGPYKPRDLGAGDEDIVLTPASRSGDNVTITSNQDIFTSDDIGVPFRLGYANPNDPYEIDWGWGKIDQVTDSKTARIDIVEPFGFEYILNPSFDAGIGFWSNKSTGTGTFTYDDVNSRAVLTHGTEKGKMKQIVEVTPNESLTLTVEIFQVDTVVRIYVGSNEDWSDYLGVQTESTTGVKSYTFTPDGDILHVQIDTVGSGSGDEVHVSEVSLVRQDLSTNEWREGAWSEEKGYPTAVAFYEQRLTFAGASSDPQTIQASKTGDYEDFGFSSPYLDTDALTYTMASKQVNAVRWMVQLSDLIAGTTGAEWKVSHGTNADAMSPTSISVKPQSYYGSAPVQSLVVGNNVLFLQRGANKVRQLEYSLERDGYIGLDISILSNHLFEGYKIEEWAYTSLPHPVVWCVRSDGVLLGLTYMPEQEVWAWHRHETDGYYESVCVLEGDDIDAVYFIVRRTINGQTRRYIEYFKPRINNESTYDYFFVDSGLTYNGDPEAPISTISGLDHLEGKEVVALANGAVVEGKVVSGGKITLDNPASFVHVGLPYTAELETLNIESTDQQGVTLGRQKQVVSATISFVKSRGCKVGTSADSMDEMKFYDEAFGEAPPPLYTGEKEITVKGGYKNAVSVIIKQPYPLPIQISAIVPNYKVK